MERMTDYKPQERQDLEELYRKQNVRIYELEQCNLNLQEWLDNKEKVNKSLREENEKLKKYYDRDKEELMESCYSLAKENDKLKSDLMEDMKEITKLEKENKKLKEKNEKLEEDNINLISFNEHYSPDVIVKYEDRYETAYNEECIENAKLCDKMRRLEEENKKLKSDLEECQCSF
jgi:hypothetical protein